jgi:hypothetical protein
MPRIWVLIGSKKITTGSKNLWNACSYVITYTIKIIALNFSQSGINDLAYEAQVSYIDHDGEDIR